MTSRDLGRMVLLILAIMVGGRGDIPGVDWWNTCWPGVVGVLVFFYVDMGKRS